MVSPQHKKKVARLLLEEHSFSVRRACNTLSLNRSTFTYRVKRIKEVHKQLEEKIESLSKKHPRYGYRRITALLRREGWQISFKKVQAMRRQQGLWVSSKQSKKSKRGSSNSQIKAARYPNHVWSWDFIFDRTERGTPIKIMTLVDEYTRRWLRFKADCSLKHQDVIETLKTAIEKYGLPKNMRSDNGPEFIATNLKRWLVASKIEINYINRGSPWENSWIESFHGKLRDECLNREIFFNLTEARIILKDYQVEYNQERPHSGLKYKTPEEFYKKCIRENQLNLLLCLGFLLKSMKTKKPKY